MRKICWSLVAFLFLALSARADEFTGRLVSVDRERMTLTAVLKTDPMAESVKDGPQRVFVITGRTDFFDGSGRRISAGIGSSRLRRGVPVEILTQKKSKVSATGDEALRIIVRN